MRHTPHDTLLLAQLSLPIVASIAPTAHLLDISIGQVIAAIDDGSLPCKRLNTTLTMIAIKDARAYKERDEQPREQE